jgi:hypothetical protein
MLPLLMRVFMYTGIVCYLFLLAGVTKNLLTQPLTNLMCNERTNWSDYDPLIYPVPCASKMQYLLRVNENVFNPLDLSIWLFLSFVVFIFAVIFRSLIYKQPEQPPRGL